MLLALLTLAPATRAEDVPAPFVTLGPAAREVVKLEPDGSVRVVTPPATLTRAFKLPKTWTAVGAVALGGDFEVSASFDVTALGGPARPPAEANVELAVVSTTSARPYGINVNANPGAGKCFHVVRYGPNRGGYHWGTLGFPRASDRGRVCLRRRGAELVFLAADGDGAALVELVRYPYDPRLSPAPRITAFQGHGADPVPVNVRLSDVKVQAERVLRDPGGALGPAGPPVSAADPPPLPAPAAYPVAVDYGANPARLLADFPRAHGEGQAFAAEPGGVRVKPRAPAGAKDPNSYWSRESRFVVSGDFEASCRIDATKVGPPSPTGNGAVEVGFSLEDDATGSVTAACGVVRGEGPRYTVTRVHPMRGGRNWDIQRMKAGGRPARVTLRRTGADLVVTAQEDGEPAASELVRFPYPPNVTPRLRVWTFQGGPPVGPVDALVSEFKVRAGRVHDPDSPDPPAASPGAAADEVVLDGLPPAPRSRKWAYLAWAGGAASAAVALVAGVLVWRKRRRAGGTS